MTSGKNGNNWDAFDWEAWGQDDGTPPEVSRTEVQGANGHLTPGASDEDEDVVPAGGQWVHQGGTLRWEESDEDERAQRGGPGGGGLRTEAASQWAEDNIALPLGAPPRIRLRAMRAWLARQQLLAQEAQGVVLIERRRAQEEAGEEDAGGGDPFAPLNLALAEHQAAAAEFERMLEALAELESHAGLDRVLIEFYLWLGDRIALLAQAAEATEDFRAAALVAEPESPPTQTRPTPLTHAEWRGQADAALSARRHAERVSAPEEEE